MSFITRSIAPSDLESCADNLRESFTYDPARKKRLIRLWKELMASGDWITAVTDDRRLPPGKRLVGFGMSVFVTEAFAARALKGLPLLSRAFLEQWEEGDRPYLSKKEVAAANAGAGLNLVVLHLGWNTQRVSPADLPKLQMKQAEQFIESHAGYKVQEYLQEVYGPALRDFVLAAGSRLVHDYSGKKWKPLLKKVSKEDWPYLTGFRPGAAQVRVGTMASQLQAKALPPRFQLAPSEKEMLAQALSGKTDEELASTLHLSHWTVKKRWQAIYLKVKKADSDLLDDLAVTGKGPEGRNRQRRRYLLDYLRDHPEELRPTALKG